MQLSAEQRWNLLDRFAQEVEVLAVERLHGKPEADRVRFYQVVEPLREENVGDDSAA